MKSKNQQKIPASLIAALGLIVVAHSTRATPYACDITNSAGIVSFRLNENADNVKVISSSGAVTNDLGPGVKGLTVTNLGVAAGVIKVMVTRSAPAGYTQSSTDLFTIPAGCTSINSSKHEALSLTRIPPVPPSAASTSPMDGSEPREHQPLAPPPMAST